MTNICILSYDAGMINNLNVVQPYLEYFNLNSELIGLNAAIISAGCIIGAPIVGPIVDRWGRKVGLAMGSISIIVGVILQASAAKISQFVIGRLLVGFATIVNGSIAPMWVMELASSRYRTILSGSVMVSVPFTAFVVAGIILGIHDSQSNWAWRGIIIVKAVPSVICLCLLPFVDESPRWLFSKDRREEAIEILARLHANNDRHHPIIIAETQEIMGALESERGTKGGWKNLVSTGPNLRRFTIAVLMNIFYQIVGANMILYFSSFIIESLEVGDTRSTILINMGLLLWNGFASLAGVFIIDRVGRRKPLIVGTAATVVLFAILAALTHLTEIHPDTKKYAIGAIVVVALFLLAVSASWMILAYTYPPEVLRYSQRAHGVVVAQAIGFAFSFLNLYTAPLAIEKISWRYYAINGGWNIGILVVVIWLFVETKGKTLEEVDEIFDGTIHTEGVIIGDLDGKEIELVETRDTESEKKRKLSHSHS
ncbi:general substrate transporter [Ilyonectria destructans]|nr:general substrate transporter [Ilyonectria destructans]